jgi:hypothetical protein
LTTPSSEWTRLPVIELQVEDQKRAKRRWSIKTQVEDQKRAKRRWSIKTQVEDQKRAKTPEQG